jgi:acyl-CoA dehydrogenase
MGQRGTMTCDVTLENVRVSAANIIGGVPGHGFKTAMKLLDRGRLNISAVACGIAQRVLDESARYARERKQCAISMSRIEIPLTSWVVKVISTRL